MLETIEFAVNQKSNLENNSNNNLSVQDAIIALTKSPAY